MRLVIPLIFSSILLSSCSYLRHFYQPLDPHEQIIADIWPVLGESEKREIRQLQSLPEIASYIDRFWDELDPIPETEVNEARMEYEARLEYVHVHFPHKRGWKHSDMGRVYLIYGPPDTIYFLPFLIDLNYHGTDLKEVEIWTYDINIGKLHKPTIFDWYDPGLIKFCFADLIGSGRFTQIFSNVPGELIDPRVFINE